MALLDIALGKIADTDLQRLIDGEAAESLYIDYKRQSYAGGDADRAEFLADISSFANTSGGDLVIGMVEEGGVPTGFSGLQIDMDAEKLDWRRRPVAG
jgi:predicted HTH transcriptional regulator